jgi:hypothetical protein
MFWVRCNMDRAGVSLLRRHINECVPVVLGNGDRVVIKPFGATQRVSYMLGYIQKDHGAEHYQVWVYLPGSAPLLLF